MAQTVKYTFLALDRFSHVSNRIGRQTDRLKRKMGGLSKATRMVGRAMIGLGVAAGAGLTAGFVAAIKVGSEFQDSVADLESIAGISGDKLAFLTGEVKRLSKVSIVEAPKVAATFKVIASVMQEIAQDPKKLSVVTEQALLLMNATGADLGMATNILTKTMSQYVVGAEEAARFTNALAAASKVGASEMWEAGPAYLKAGVAARLAKVPFEELLAVIQVLAKGGLAGPEAGTLLSSMLIKMEDKALKGLTPSVDGLTESLMKLGAFYKAGKLTTPMLTDFVEMEGLRPLGILLELNQLLPVFRGKIEGSNTAVEQAAIRMATLNKKMEKIGITVKLRLIDAFDSMEPKLKSMANEFQRWLDMLTSEDVQMFVDDMLAIAGAVAAVSRGIAGLLKLRQHAGLSIFSTEPVSAVAGAYVNKLMGRVDVNVTTEKGMASEVTARAKDQSGFDFPMGVNMANAYGQ